MENAVIIERLTKRFGDFTAVDQVNLTVARGEIFGFLGANGAGKTTVIRMLCGLLLPTSGTGRVSGFDIFRESERIKKSIGYMSQKFSLYGNLSVCENSLYQDLTGEENLEFFGSVYQIPPVNLKKRIDELSVSLDLSEFIGRLSGSLPVGWRQRLALAAALLHSPQILFLDEPTAGVDPVFRRRFWEILYRLAEGGTTIFVTTHYMDEAEFCQRISIMHQGRIIEVGNPQALIRQYQQRSLQDLFVFLISRRNAGE